MGSELDDWTPPFDPDDAMRLPAVAGWHEQIALSAHDVVARLRKSKRGRPRVDDVWLKHGVNLHDGKRGGYGWYASDLAWRLLNEGKKPPRCVPTSEEVRLVFEALQPRIGKHVADWHRNLDPRDIVQESLIGVWRGVRALGLRPALRPVEKHIEPRMPQEHIGYLLATIDNALVNYQRKQFGSAVPANVRARLDSTIPLEAWEQSRQDEWVDPTDSWDEWLTVREAVNTSPYRLTITMHVAGYSDKEIAKATGMAVNSVRQRRSELRRELRSLW